MVFSDLRKTIAKAIHVSTNKKVEANEIVKAPKPEMGDLAYACFSLAKDLGKNPVQCAEEISADLTKDLPKLVKQVKAVGPYVNFYLDTPTLAKELISKIKKSDEQFACSSKSGKKIKKTKKILFEYSGLNTHKEVHIGHIRNHSLGSSIVRLLRTQGHEVIPVDFVNDFGMNVAKCVWGLQKFYKGKLDFKSDSKSKTKNKMEALADVYVEATAKMEEGGEQAKKEVSDVLIAIEGNPKSPEHKLWKETREWSLQGFYNIYKEMELDFEERFFESDVKSKGKEKVQELLKQGVVKKSQGAVIADLEDQGLGVLLLLKSDGTGLYSTTDLALVDAKLKKYPDVDASVIVTDFRQSQYFMQLFKVLEMSGLKKELVHIAYEFVTLPKGAMSTRKGNVIRYRELRDALKEKAAQEIKLRHKDWSKEKIENTAHAIAMGAMKFTMISVGSNQKIVFDMDAALALNGMSSLYLQYTGARLNNILQKTSAQKVSAKKSTTAKKADFKTLEKPIEHQLLKHLLWYEFELTQSAKNYDPSILVRWIYELCQLSSSFYEQCRVLDDSGEVHEARKELTEVVAGVLKQGLQILGVPHLEEI